MVAGERKSQACEGGKSSAERTEAWTRRFHVFSRQNVFGEGGGGRENGGITDDGLKRTERKETLERTTQWIIKASLRGNTCSYLGVRITRKEMVKGGEGK